MFVSWMNLILFLRRLPGVGIYIVMVGEVFITFLKFFVFCFSLFIFAFGFTFYVVLRNQIPFQTPLYAFVKTGVMMIGELRLDMILNNQITCVVLNDGKKCLLVAYATEVVVIVQLHSLK